MTPSEDGGRVNEVERAQRRSLGWRTLALAFYEPTGEWVRGVLDGAVSAALEEAIGWLDTDKELFDPGLNSIREFTGDNRFGDAAEVLRDVNLEYTRLFLGPGHMPAPPYESVYRDRDPQSGAPIVMGPSTLAVRRFYQERGLRLAPSRKDLPDHVATELEFMYFLSHKEQEAWNGGDEEAARELRHAQQEFLQGHLASWLPQFCNRVQEATISKLYWGLADFARQYLAVAIGEPTTASPL